MQKTCTEYEDTLEEVGANLSETKLQIEQLKETSHQVAEAHWTPDKAAATCKLCDKEFSVARRRVSYYLKNICQLIHIIICSF